MMWKWSMLSQDEYPVDFLKPRSLIAMLSYPSYLSGIIRLNNVTNLVVL
jgi:hypothetical protein